MDLRIQRALGFINENFGKKLTLKMVIRHCSLSVSRFSELFKKETGITFKQYLKLIRMEKAGELLRDNSLSIKQISYEVGYRSVSTFCYDFKKMKGLTPSDYRRKKRKKTFQRNRKLQ